MAQKLPLNLLVPAARPNRSFFRKALCSLLLLRRSRLQRFAEGLLSPRAASVALVLGALYASPKLPARSNNEASETTVTSPAPALRP